jgi:addiction module HigA family antidote
MENEKKTSTKKSCVKSNNLSLSTATGRGKYHPGYYLRQDLEALQMSPLEFAQQTGLSEQQVLDLLHEKIALTTSLAEKISAFFGTSLSLWLGLQKSYDEPERT